MTLDASTRRVRRSRLAALALVPVLLVLAACSGTTDGLAEQFREGSDKGFISGDGRVVEIPLEQRSEPIVFSGVTEHGDTVTSDDFRGQVLVVNFWYNGCAPCRAEAGDLQKVFAEYDGAGATFLGVNIYDQPDTAISFAQTYGVTYPSVMATSDGPLKMAFAAEASLQAAPTTLVIDATGRVTARIVGAIDGPSTLSTLVREAIAEGAAGTGS